MCSLAFFFFFWRGVGGWSFESARRDEQGTLDEQQRTRWWHFSQQRPRQLLLFSQDRVPPKLDKREEPEGEYFKRGRCSARSWKSWRSQESVLSPAAPKIIMSSETLRSAQRICCLFLRTWTENQVRIYLSRRAAEPKLTCIHLGRASANWHVPRWVKIKKTRLRINIQLMQLKKKKMQLLASHVFLHPPLSTWDTRHGNPAFLCFICNWSFARRWPLTRSTLCHTVSKAAHCPATNDETIRSHQGLWKVTRVSLCVCLYVCMCVFFLYSCNPGINNNLSTPPRLLQIDYNYRPSVPLSVSQKQSWCDRCCSLIRSLKHPSKMSFPTLAIHW